MKAGAGVRARVTIVGAGLVGSLLAIFLARRGYAVHVVERRPDPRSGRVVGGRSINLALSDRGLLALERAGIAAQIEEVAIPMRGRMVHALDGATALLPYGRDDQSIRSVSRGGLNTTLIDLASRENGVRMTFEQRCVAVDVRKTTLTLEGNVVRAEHDADILIGADGAFSAVRYAMQTLERFDYSQEHLAHGYKELTIPPGSAGAYRLEKNALHIWPRSSLMLIALPNRDGSFTCTLFFALDGEPSFASLDTPAKAREFFRETFPDALALMPSFDDDWVQNPVSSLVTVRCHPWSHAHRTLLIGDAAHAIVPFFGQGMNAGFEDCRVLMEILDETHDDWTTAMPMFERARKENADAIAVLALENFVEMRDKVADAVFLLEKRIEKRMAMLEPALVIPKYTMVTFTPSMPYAEALRRGRAQDRMLSQAARIPGIAATLDSGAHDEALRALVREQLRT
jgi:kynurenine 3-monooxygenase